MAYRFTVEAIFKAIDAITKPVAKMGASVQAFATKAAAQLKTVDDTLGKVSGVLSKAYAYTAVAATATGAALYKVGSAGADFEQAITNVAAVSLVSRKDIAELEKKALQLGATTKFTATEVANAMEMMGKAGFSNAEVMSGIGGTLAAAAAEGAGLEETASNISNVLKGMGLETSKASDVADVLALASARTNSSISSIAESMKNASVTARGFGISLNDTVTMVSLLQDVGMDASEAGNAVNAMLLKLATPTAGARAEMARLGISFEDAQHNMLPLTDVLKQFIKAADKSGGNMKQFAFFTKMLDVRGQRAGQNLRQLFQEGKFGKLQAELEGAAGSAEKMAAIRMDTLLGDVETLGGSIDSIEIALYNTESGPLRRIVQNMTKWLDANAKLIEQKVTQFIQDAIPVIKAFGAGVLEGAQNVEKWALSATNALGPITDLFGDSAKTRTENAQDFGRKIVEAAAIFYGLELAVKAARAAVFAFDLMVKVVRGTIWFFAVITRLANWALLTYEIATKAGAAGALALQFASQAATVDLIRQRVAAFAAAGGMTALAGAAGLAVTAIGALMLVRQANEELKSQTGGMGFFDIAGAMIDQGTWDPFKVVDRHQNEQAKLAAESKATAVNTPGIDQSMQASIDALSRNLEINAQSLGSDLPPGAPPQIAAPGARTATLIQEKREKVEAEITIRDETGRGELTKKPPPGTPVKVRVRPSGSL